MRGSHSAQDQMVRNLVTESEIIYLQIVMQLLVVHLSFEDSSSFITEYCLQEFSEIEEL